MNKLDLSHLYEPCTLSDVRQYAQCLIQDMNRWLGYKDGLTIWATIFDYFEDIHPKLVVINFNENKAHPFPPDHIEVLSKGEMTRAFKKTGKPFKPSLFRHYTKDKLYICKPNERRFFVPAVAVNDANEVIGEILAKAWKQ